MYDLNAYNLPTINFIGGSTQKLSFNVYSKSKNNPSNLEGCTANFSMIDFSNRFDSPVLSKGMSISSGGDTEILQGTHNLLSVTLIPKETASLSGKYIYQITIKTPDNEVSIPSQGIIFITKNINESFLG